jgi:hypothetical protein
LVITAASLRAMLRGYTQSIWADVHLYGARLDYFDDKRRLIVAAPLDDERDLVRAVMDYRTSIDIFEGRLRVCL